MQSVQKLDGQDHDPGGKLNPHSIQIAQEAGRAHLPASWCLIDTTGQITRGHRVDRKGPPTVETRVDEVGQPSLSMKPEAVHVGVVIVDASMPEKKRRRRNRGRRNSYKSKRWKG